MVTSNMDGCHLPRRLTERPDVVNPALKEPKPAVPLPKSLAATHTANKDSE